MYVYMYVYIYIYIYIIRAPLGASRHTRDSDSTHGLIPIGPISNWARF